jgi:hypothetical protein
MAEKLSISNFKIEDLGSLAILSFYAGQIQLRSKKKTFVEIADLFVIWTKEFEVKFVNAREDPNGEHWEDKIWTFIWEKIEETNHEFDWTHL